MMTRFVFGRRERRSATALASAVPLFLREDRVTLIRLGDQDVERVLEDRHDGLEAVVLVSHIGGADAEYRHNLKLGCHAEHALLVLDKVGAEDVDTENDESTCAVVAKVDPRPSDPESHHDTLDGQLVGNVPSERAHQEVAENDKSSRSVALVHEDLLLGAHIIIEVGGRQNHFPCILEVTDRALDDRWRRPMDLSDGRRRKLSDGRKDCVTGGVEGVTLVFWETKSESYERKTRHKCQQKRVRLTGIGSVQGSSTAT